MNPYVDMALTLLYKVKNEDKIEESELDYVISGLETMVLAGDDDESIYDMKGKRVPKSYRGPTLRVRGRKLEKIEDFMPDDHPRRGA